MIYTATDTTITTTTTTTTKVSISCVCKALLVLGAPLGSGAAGIYKMLVHTSESWTTRPIFIKVVVVEW
jgi:hypothetical protein